MWLQEPPTKIFPAFKALVRHHALFERLQLLHQRKVLLPVLLEPHLLQPGYRWGGDLEDLRKDSVGHVCCVAWLGDHLAEPEPEEVVDLCFGEPLNDSNLCATYNYSGLVQLVS